MRAIVQQVVENHVAMHLLAAKEDVVRMVFAVRTVSRMIVVMRKGTVTRVVCV